MAPVKMAGGQMCAVRMLPAGKQNGTLSRANQRRLCRRTSMSVNVSDNETQFLLCFCRPIGVAIAVIQRRRQWLKCKIGGGGTLHSGLGP